MLFMVNPSFASSCNSSEYTVKLFLGCPFGIFEISDQRMSKHTSFRLGLFGYTSARSIIGLATIPTPWRFPALDFGTIDFLYTQTWRVCCGDGEVSEL